MFNGKISQIIPWTWHQFNGLKNYSSPVIYAFFPKLDLRRKKQEKDEIQLRPELYTRRQKP